MFFDGVKKEPFIFKRVANPEHVVIFACSRVDYAAK